MKYFLIAFVLSASLSACGRTTSEASAKDSVSGGWGTSCSASVRCDDGVVHTCQTSNVGWDGRSECVFSYNLGGSISCGVFDVYGYAVSYNYFSCYGHR